jgi:hypothetical protein
MKPNFLKIIENKRLIATSYKKMGLQPIVGNKQDVLSSLILLGLDPSWFPPKHEGPVNNDRAFFPLYFQYSWFNVIVGHYARNRGSPLRRQYS